MQVTSLLLYNTIILLDLRALAYHPMDTTHQLFPVCRYSDCGKSSFYYPYGNTPAEDFLENVHPNSVKKPDILVLGCGDIRSCFYTLWKHFSLTRDINDAASSFSGVHFVLNDHSAAVLARNVIFLYLCLQKPSDVHSTEFNQWLSALWAIWFSKNLHPDHKKVLDSALRDLLHCSTDTKSWASKENQLNSFVQFSSECTLNKIHDVLNMWLTHSFNKERDNKKMEYISLSFSTSKKTDIENLNGMAVTAGLSSSVKEKMELEISNCSNGNSFAEYVIGNGQVLPVMKLVANVTMYDRTEPEENYLMDSSVPFRCFHHAFRFTPSQLKTSCTHTLLNQLIVSDEKFQEYPLLANSVQQLALWLSCTSILTPTTSAAQQEACIKFTFNCSDAIQFCDELQNGLYDSILKTDRFDVVYTSNLLDPIHPPNVVLFAMPLLKAEGYLFTTTMKYKLLAKSTNDYIAQSFGIDNKMLPMLFGIRCINHEGDEYRSQVSIKPVPVETNSITLGFTPYYPKVIIWQKLPSMIIQDISPDSNLWRALYSSISVILSISLEKVNTSSSQTAVKMLQTFLAHVNGDDTDSKFWDPFCSLLKCNYACKQHLLVLQTHSILNGVHLHLLVTDKTCPICNKIPMSNFFGQISVSIPPLTEFHEVQHYARVYKSKERTQEYSTFDCFAFQHDSNSVKMNFIVPLHLCASNHYVSIACFNAYRAPQVLKDGPLKSFLSSKITYSFSKPKPSHRKSDIISTTLGCLQSHYGNGDTFQSIIALSEDGYSMYASSKKIHPEELSPSEIRLSCGVHKFDLSYPHPINFSNLSIKISRSRKTLTIEASRKTYEFYDEEAPLFLVYPDCRVTLPQLNVHEIALKYLMNMQCTPSEVLQLSPSGEIPLLPLTDLKDIINSMMQVKDETYFVLTDTKSCLFGMVIVINRVFDYQVKAPAIDLIYRVTTEESAMKKWMRFAPNPSSVEIMRSTIELMDKVFLYFSKRTVSSSPLKSLLKVKRKVDACFKRAVVYPLYSDPDDNVRNQVTWNEIKSDPFNRKRVKTISCTFCGHISVGIFTCEKCLTVKFCVKCKRQHFSEHEVSCNAKKSDTVKPLSSATLSSSPQPAAATKCNFCFKQSSKLKKCSNCHSVQYCSLECQVKHWKEHKTDCRSKIDQPLSDSQNDSVLELSSDLNKFVLCHQTSPTLKGCSNCLSVKYCSKECQKKHWSEHKMVCKQQSEVLNESTACSYCSKVSSSLKKCTLCHAAQYCDKECQTKHWKIHKLQCKSEPVDLSTSLSKSANAELEHESQKCSFCSRQAKELKKCTRCHNTQYCDRTCQQKHWASHKNTCKPVSSKN